MDFHWGKHHRAYVTNMNKQIEGTDLADKPIEEVRQHMSRERMCCLGSEPLVLVSCNSLWSTGWCTCSVSEADRTKRAASARDASTRRQASLLGCAFLGPP